MPSLSGSGGGPNGQCFKFSFFYTAEREISGDFKRYRRKVSGEHEVSGAKSKFNSTSNVNASVLCKFFEISAVLGDIRSKYRNPEVTLTGGLIAGFKLIVNGSNEGFAGYIPVKRKIFE